MFVRAYLRASTDEQDASRGKSALLSFANGHGLTIASYYAENESGATLARPQLMRLLEESQPGDILLTEQVDRLSRLKSDDWEKLKGLLQSRRVKVVALDLPTSWNMVKADAFTESMFAAINSMMLDMLAAVSRKDYEDRRRRQGEGIAKAKTEGLYKGRPEDKKRNAGITAMLKKGQSWNSIVAATGCSRSTLSKLAKRWRLQTA